MHAPTKTQRQEQTPNISSKSSSKTNLVRKWVSIYQNRPKLVAKWVVIDSNSED